MEQESFKYYAFISYSHKDQIIAKKLQNSLEHYHLPSALLKSHPHLPKNLTPIFMDESDLIAVGPLKDTLETYLDKSNYLIVICSPSSAKSPYVNDEVKYFIDKGRIGRIVPLIIEGVPHSDDPEKECFPQALRDLPRDLEPLGIDFQKFDERSAFLRVIATLLQLDLDSFVSRIIKARRRKIALLSFLASALMVIAGMFVWHNIPHSRYYASYVYRHEKPIGLFEVESEAFRKKMEYSYKFTTLRGEVQKIERVNSAGVLVDPTIATPLLEPPMVCFVSDRTVEYYDLDRHKIYRKEYTKNMQAADMYCGDDNVPYALPSDTYELYSNNQYDPSISLFRNTGSVRRITLAYDSSGYVTKKMFRSDTYGGRDKQGTPAQDAKGRWGFSYKVDELGRVTEVRNLDKDGNPKAVLGVYAEYMEYGDMPYPVKDYRMDRDGNLVPDQSGVAYDIVSYDQYFNACRFSCYGADGERVLYAELNVSETVYTHDPDNGFMTSMSFYDEELKPCIHKDGYFREERTYNGEGRRIKSSYFGVDGRKIIRSDGYANFHIEYNKNGQRVRSFSTGEDDKPVPDDSNMYGDKYSYEDGLLTRIDDVDAEGKPMLNKYGYASMLFSYDKRENKVVRITFQDTEGRNTMTSFGHAEIHFTYEDGNISSWTFYDADGNLAADESGAAKFVLDWENGRRVSQEYFDAQGRPMMNARGYAKIEFVYDENGLKLWERYYDTEGRRVIIPDGYSAVKFDYDIRGRRTRVSYYDADDHYLMQPNEYYSYGKTYEYDDRGNTTRIHYLREENSKYQDFLDCLVEDAYYEYDKRGNETARYWFSGKGDAVDSRSNTGGTVREEREYDAHGRVIKTSWYRAGEKTAWMIQDNKQDSHGRIVYTHTISLEDGSMDIIVQKNDYDEFGRLTREYYLDGESKPFIPAKSVKGMGALDYAVDYSVREVQHDVFGNETDIRYYDENSQPLSSDSRAFRDVRTYDFSGNLLTHSSYNSVNDDDPVEVWAVSGKKAHREARRYDALGRETVLEYFGADGGLVLRTMKSYSGSGKSFGKVTTTETYGYDGKPSVDRYTGTFGTMQAYDVYGNVSDYWYYDADHEPCRRVYKRAEAWHHEKRSYDAMGKLLSVEFFDTEEKPCSRDGVHKVLYAYNSYGLCTEEAQYDQEQKLLRKLVTTYDSDGNKTGQEWVQ